MVGKDVIAEIGSTCVLMRSRLVARLITGIYDEELQPFAIGSALFALLVVIYKNEPANRAKLGRLLHLDCSTLTRHLRVILSKGWAEEIRYQADTRNKPDGRSRPIVLTKAGKDLLHNAEPAWRVAQANAVALLGKDGLDAVMEIANRIIELTA